MTVHRPARCWKPLSLQTQFALNHLYRADLSRYSLEIYSFASFSFLPCLTSCLFILILTVFPWCARVLVCVTLFYVGSALKGFQQTKERAVIDPDTFFGICFYKHHKMKYFPPFSFQVNIKLSKLTCNTTDVAVVHNIKTKNK